MTTRGPLHRVVIRQSFVRNYMCIYLLGPKSNKKKENGASYFPVCVHFEPKLYTSHVPLQPKGGVMPQWCVIMVDCKTDNKTKTLKGKVRYVKTCFLINK